MPIPVKITKLFGQNIIPNIPKHFSTELSAANIQCLQDLQSIDPSDFAADDIVFLTSLNSTRILAYGQWIEQIASRLKAKLGIYAITSSEVDDTIGRELKRQHIPLSDDSFEQLDKTTTPNELKRSMYRFLFNSIPKDKASRYKIS